MADDHDNEVDYDEEEEEQQQQQEQPSSPARREAAAAGAADAAAASSSGLKAKGRGHQQRGREDDSHRGGHYESVDEAAGAGPAKSVEGWVVMVTGVHEEAQEDEVVDRFGEFGDVKNVQMNLDRRTGFVKGYALIEFGKRSEAEAAIKEMDGETLYDKPVRVDWAFVNPGGKRGGGGGR